MKVRTIIAVLVLLLNSRVLADDLLAGDARKLWLVRPAESGETSDVFYKELGVSWRVSARNQTKVPVAAVADGDALHLFYADRQHVIVNALGDMRVAANLPGDFLAVCSGENFGGLEKDQSAVFVLVRRDEPPKPPFSTTQPTTAAATTQPQPATPAPRECLYRATGNDWTPVAWGPVAPDDAPAPDAPVYLAILKGQLYQLMHREGKSSVQPSLLRRYSPARNGQAGWDVIHTFPAEQFPVGMAAVKNRLLVVHRTGEETTTTAPTKFSLAITRYAPDSKVPFTTQPITRNQKDVTWPADASPRVSRLGDQLAILRQDGKTIYFTLCSPSGALGEPENVTEELQSMPDTAWASDLYNYFLLGVVILIGVGMFFRRFRQPPKPFLLPKNLIPGNLFKRLLAALVDFLPLYFLSGIFFLPTNLNLDAVQQMIEHPETAPPSLLVATIYTIILSQGLYIVYGTIMDLRYGATPGKMLLRLRSVNENGRKPNFREAVLRNFTKAIELSMLVSPMAWLMMIFVLLPLLTRNRQRLGDMIARTAVVERRSLPTPPSIPTGKNDESTN
ncbi:MAG: RDD family protein [Phycisphaerae bacterium]|nr:RDD family protein [Phycisphaerae bacterium]